MNKKGFTLIELMIVVAIIAIIAAIAIPGLLRARIASNESSAIGTLRTLSTSELQFQQGAHADQDADGTGEFGVFNELTGFQIPRKTNGTVLQPGILPSGLSVRTAGTSAASKSGYQFQVLLPGAAYVTDVGGTTTQLAFVSGTQIDVQENKFRSYGWPVTTKTTGVRCFAVDANSNEIIAAPNLSGTNAVYTGLTVPPAANAALSTTETSTGMEGLFKIDGSTAQDGQVWAPAGN